MCSILLDFCADEPLSQCCHNAAQNACLCTAIGLERATSMTRIILPVWPLGLPGLVSVSPF